MHRLDAARLFRLALEQAPAGTRLNGAGDEGVPFRVIAEAIGRHLDVPVHGLPPADARDHFGTFAIFASCNAPASSARTRSLLGWSPVHAGLIEDLESGHYFG